jgi:hypothetical protein
MRMVVVAATVVTAIVAAVSGCAPLGPQLYPSPYRVSPGPELYGGPYPGPSPERYGDPYATSPPDPDSGPYQGPPPGPELYDRSYHQGYEPNGGYYVR